MKKQLLFQIIDRIKAHSVDVGSEAHRAFSPMKMSKRVVPVNPRQSAVMILLYPSKDGVKFVLTQRHSYKGVHSSQISLPGGKLETGESPEEAAKRETFEEIGVPSGDIEIIKKLSGLYIPPSNFWVTPFVGVLPYQPSFIKDAFEVREIIEVDIDVFLSTPISILNISEMTDNQYLTKVPVYRIQNKSIWGATGMILNEFKHVLLF